MIAFVPAMVSDLPCGIVFYGERNPLIGEISGELYRLGLFRDRAINRLTPELMDALNRYRRANLLPESDYCDPATLRTLLGIDVGGDALILLARLSESGIAGRTEVERYDYCRYVLSRSRELGLTIQRYIDGIYPVGELLGRPAPMSDSVKLAVLASIMESGR